MLPRCRVSISLSLICYVESRYDSSGTLLFEILNDRSMIVLKFKQVNASELGFG